MTLANFSYPVLTFWFSCFQRLFELFCFQVFWLRA